MNQQYNTLIKELEQQIFEKCTRPKYRFRCLIEAPIEYQCNSCRKLSTKLKKLKKHCSTRESN